MTDEQFRSIMEELRNIRVASGGDSVAALMILAAWYYGPTIWAWIALAMVAK